MSIYISINFPQTGNWIKQPLITYLTKLLIQFNVYYITPKELYSLEKNSFPSLYLTYFLKTVSDSELAKFRCQLCPKGFKHPTSLTLHKDSHAGKTQCPVCHRSFSRSYDMRSHLQRIHQGKQLTIKEIRYKGNSDSASVAKQFTSNI